MHKATRRSRSCSNKAMLCKCVCNRDSACRHTDEKEDMDMDLVYLDIDQRVYSASSLIGAVEMITPMITPMSDAAAV